VGAEPGALPRLLAIVSELDESDRRLLIGAIGDKRMAIAVRRAEREIIRSA
jgi:hypothetical protein